MSAVTALGQQPAAAELRSQPFSWRRRIVYGFSSDWASLLGLAFLVVVLALAILAPIVSPADPYQQSLATRLRPPLWERNGFTFVFGTDQLGRDIFSRMIYGARISLPLALSASLISLAFGTLVGVYSGFVEGKIGLLIMRLADMQIAFPYLVIAIAIIAVLGANLVTLVVTLSIFGWATYARVANAEVLTIKQREYILAARAIGVSNARIMLLHVLPNVLSPLVVLWTFNVATLIIVESSLSFIGLGIQPPNPSWGSMLSDGRDQLNNAWWLATFPGLAIMLTVLAINMVGDRLRDILDPRLLR